MDKEQALEEIQRLHSELEEINSELRTGPDKVDLLYRRADLKRHLALLKNDRSLACEALEDNCKAVEIRLNDPFAWLERGLTYYILDQQDKAISDYNHSLSIEESSRAYYNLGIARWRKLETSYEGDATASRDAVQLANQVLRDYELALQIDPSFADALYNRGNVYLRLGEYCLAIHEFTRCVEVEPTDYLAYFNRAICREHVELPRYSNKPALQKAIKDYSRVIELNPTYIQAYLNRAVCYEMTGEGERYKSNADLELAVRDYSEVLRQDPNNPHALYNRAWALEHLGRYSEALTDYRQFIQVSEDRFAVGQLSVHVERLLARQNLCQDDSASFRF